MDSPHLQVLHPKPEGNKHAPLSVDIVAIHGLFEDAANAWTKPGSSFNWLQNYLPADVKGARVLTYHYDSNSTFRKSDGDVRGCARSFLDELATKRQSVNERPLVLIGHCFGGILIKEALVQANEDHQFQNIIDRTIGIVFFGTPHQYIGRPSSKGIGHLFTTGTTKVARDCNHALAINEKLLSRLRNSFRHMTPFFKIVTFYEIEPIGRGSDVVVKRQEALMELPNEEQIPVYTNHFEMCKFGLPDHPTYENLYKRINRMIAAEVKEPHPQGSAVSTMPTSSRLVEVREKGTLQEPDPYSQRT